MRKRGRSVLAAVIIAALGGLAWWELAAQHGPPDPVYDGHRLSYWVSQDPRNGTMFSRRETTDSNAVPYLIEMLKTKDGALREAYNRLWLHLPGWLENRVAAPEYSWTLRENACFFLGDLGPDARPAIPELVRSLSQDENGSVRTIAALALGTIATRDDKTVIEALTSATKDHDGFVKQSAIHSLIHIDPEAAAKAGVP